MLGQLVRRQEKVSQTKAYAIWLIRRKPHLKAAVNGIQYSPAQLCGSNNLCWGIHVNRILPSIWFHIHKSICCYGSESFANVNIIEQRNHSCFSKSPWFQHQYKNQFICMLLLFMVFHWGCFSLSVSIYQEIDIYWYGSNPSEPVGALKRQEVCTKLAFLCESLIWLSCLGVCLFLSLCQQYVNSVLTHALSLSPSSPRYPPTLLVCSKRQGGSEALKEIKVGAKQKKK